MPCQRILSLSGAYRRTSRGGHASSVPSVGGRRVRARPRRRRQGRVVPLAGAESLSGSSRALPAALMRPRAKSVRTLAGCVVAGVARRFGRVRLGTGTSVGEAEVALGGSGKRTSSSDSSGRIGAVGMPLSMSTARRRTSSSTRSRCGDAGSRSRRSRSARICSSRTRSFMPLLGVGAVGPFGAHRHTGAPNLSADAGVGALPLVADRVAGESRRGTTPVPGPAVRATPRDAAGDGGGAFRTLRRRARPSRRTRRSG